MIVTHLGRHPLLGRREIPGHRRHGARALPRPLGAAVRRRSARSAHRPVATTGGAVVERASGGGFFCYEQRCIGIGFRWAGVPDSASLVSSASRTGPPPRCPRSTARRRRRLWPRVIRLGSARATWRNDAELADARPPPFAARQCVHPHIPRLGRHLVVDRATFDGVRLLVDHLGPVRRVIRREDGVRVDCLAGGGRARPNCTCSGRGWTAPSDPRPRGQPGLRRGLCLRPASVRPAPDPGRERAHRHRHPAA